MQLLCEARLKLWRIALLSMLIRRLLDASAIAKVQAMKPRAYALTGKSLELYQNCDSKVSFRWTIHKQWH